MVKNANQIKNLICNDIFFQDFVIFRTNEKIKLKLC